MAMAGAFQTVDDRRNGGFLSVPLNINLNGNNDFYIRIDYHPQNALNGRVYVKFTRNPAFCYEPFNGLNGGQPRYYGVFGAGTHYVNVRTTGQILQIVTLHVSIKFSNDLDAITAQLLLDNPIHLPIAIHL